MATSVEGAVSVNITGMFDSIGLSCFSSSLIQDNNESRDEDPETETRI